MTATTRRRPGPVPRLSRAGVVDAALAVMREQGLDAVSFRTVSTRLGVNPMALYTYVASKDELLAGMYDAVLERLELAESDAAPIDQLVDYYARARQLLLDSADLYRLVRPATVPFGGWQTVERLSSLFRALGLDEQQSAARQRFLLQLTYGSALYAALLEDVDPGAENEFASWLRAALEAS
jgi:AcrR family transcriptional regulator